MLEGHSIQRWPRPARFPPLWRPPDPGDPQLSRLAAVPGQSAAVPGEVNGSLILPREARLSRSQVRWREPRSVPVKNFIRTDRGSPSFRTRRRPRTPPAYSRADRRSVAATARIRSLPSCSVTIPPLAAGCHRTFTDGLPQATSAAPLAVSGFRTKRPFALPGLVAGPYQGGVAGAPAAGLCAEDAQPARARLRAGTEAADQPGSDTAGAARVAIFFGIHCPARRHRV